MINVIIYIISSIFIIFALHQLYNYFVDIYAPRKVKNLSNLYAQKYMDMIKSTETPINNIDITEDIQNDVNFASEHDKMILINGLNAFTNETLSFPTMKSDDSINVEWL